MDDLSAISSSLVFNSFDGFHLVTLVGNLSDHRDEALVIVIPTQRSLPLNDHQFIITFTNTDIQTRTLASFSQPHLSFIARTNNRATHSSGFHIFDLRRSPSPGTEEHTLLETSDIPHCTLSTHVPRVPYVCTRKSSTFRRGTRGSSCNTRRSCPGSTLLRYHVWGVSALCTVLSDLMGHPRPSR